MWTSRVVVSESPLGRPVQVAYAVVDVVAAAASFAESTGAGPFFVIDHVPLSSARVRGADGQFDHSSAYGQWGEVMVELVEEHSAPAIVAAPGIHHLAFMVPDLRAATQRCVALGWPEVLFARTTGGQEFAFCDARATLGHLVELYEPSPRLTGFYAMVRAAAAGWDGTSVVRRVGAHPSGPPANQRSNIGRIALDTSSTINPLGGWT
jgi:catechol 2,3-dioxygenase-like lactoylglutathione lyase family enzyme